MNDTTEHTTEHTTATREEQKWHKAGLPGRPFFRDDSRKDVYLDPESLIADPSGKVIFVTCEDWTAADQAADVLSEHIDRDIRMVQFGSHSEAYAFTALPVFPRRSLTLPERAAVASIAFYFSHYRAGLRIDKQITLPMVVRDSSYCDGMPNYTFHSEERAYMLADICQRSFYLEADVVEDTDGWIVVVRNDNGGSIDAERLANLQGVCRMLRDFTAAVGDDDMFTEITECPEKRLECQEKRLNGLGELGRILADINERLNGIETAVSSSLGAESSGHGKSAKRRSIQGKLPKAG